MDENNAAVRESNPYNDTFGRVPRQYISRVEQSQEEISTFESQDPSTSIYMIAGVRGAGKTVMLSELSHYFSGRKNWIVVNLSPDVDMMADAAAILKRSAPLRRLSPWGKVSMSVPPLSISAGNTAPDPEVNAMMYELLGRLQKKGYRVLFLLDEVVNNDYVKVFSGYFQDYKAGILGICDTESSRSPVGCVCERPSRQTRQASFCPDRVVII